jgi:hypothetical protein
VAVFVIGTNFVLSLLTNQLILRNFPNSGDEYSYLLSAHLFAEGRLHVPSPEPRDFFDLNHVVNDGRFYGKYPPGWPALLAVGILLGIPWIINPLLSAATQAACFAIARRHFSPGIANIAMILLLANPFILFNSASYFSHSSCLLLVTLGVGGALDWLKNPASRAAPLVTGASAGAAFLIRPYTALVAMVLSGAFLLAGAWKSGRLLSLGRSMIWCVLPALALLAVNLLYNRLQTGSLFVSPFTKYSATDSPSLPALADLPGQAASHLGTRLLQLALWVPLSPLFALLYLARSPAPSEGSGTLLVALPAGLLLAYLFYRGSGGNRYGPRYLFEATTSLILVSALVIHSAREKGFLLALAVLLMSGATLIWAAVLQGQMVRDRSNPYDLVERQGIRNALVFLKSGTGTMGPLDLTRNGIHFDGPVLYVLDLGERNREILRRYPDRKAFYYEFDDSSGTGRLWPWGQGGSERARVTDAAPER